MAVGADLTIFGCRREPGCITLSSFDRQSAQAMLPGRREAHSLLRLDFLKQDNEGE
jgi:hypothetical protein